MENVQGKFAHHKSYNADTTQTEDALTKQAISYMPGGSIINGLSDGINKIFGLPSEDQIQQQFKSMIIGQMFKMSKIFPYMCFTYGGQDANAFIKLNTPPSVIDFVSYDGYLSRKKSDDKNPWTGRDQGNSCFYFPYILAYMGTGQPFEHNDFEAWFVNQDVNFTPSNQTEASKTNSSTNPLATTTTTQPVSSALSSNNTMLYIAAAIVIFIVIIFSINN
jgi:hypothetical protein